MFIFVKMVRKAKDDNPVDKIFNYDRDLNISVCTIGDCKAPFKRRHGGNQKAHLKRYNIF